MGRRQPSSSTDGRPPAGAPLALTQGDPAGIGLDIALMAWLARESSALPPFALYGDADALAARADDLGLVVPVAVVTDIGQAATVFTSGLPVVPVPLAAPCVAGHPERANASAIIHAIERATAAVASGEARALVTLPVAKSVLYEAGFTHPGHTEYLAELALQHVHGVRCMPVMMLVADELRVVPLTIHVPLAAVPRLVTRELVVQTLRIMHRALVDDFGLERPCIAVAGLNPHAGEEGAMGSEDRDVIAPAVAELQREGVAATGPHSADTLFRPEARLSYDAVLAMYHDQALIPIKTLAFDRAVNVTLGLPFVRTSPDHGTAFGLAGTGRASPKSLIAALRLAADMAERRARVAA